MKRAIARAPAARADADVSAGAVGELGVDATQVGPLDALGLDVRVADVVGDPPMLAAN